EKKIEVRREPPPAMPKEIPERRVAAIRVHRFRIEVIRQIERADRQTNRVLRIDLHVLGEPRVYRKKVGITGRIWDADVALRNIRLDIWKPRAPFDYWSDLNCLGQPDHAPGQEAIRQVCPQNAVLILVNDRCRNGSQVASKVVQIA